MTQAETAIVSVAASQLGGPDAPAFALCASRAITILGDIAGEGMRMTSLSIDVTSHVLEEQNVEISVRTDKRAKSIVFASAEARAGDKLVFKAQGLFCRAG